MTNVLSFPVNRCRPPGYGPAYCGTVIPFPSLAGNQPPTRAEIAGLVNQVASLAGVETREVNLALLRSGYPRRAQWTPDDLRRIKAHLHHELSCLAREVSCG